MLRWGGLFAGYFSYGAARQLGVPRRQLHRLRVHVFQCCDQLIDDIAVVTLRVGYVEHELTIITPKQASR